MLREGLQAACSPDLRHTPSNEEEAVHLKRAYWIRHTHFLKADEYVCSACKCTCKKPLSECPSCGARMGKGKSDLTWIDEADAFFEIMEDDW